MPKLRRENLPHSAVSSYFLNPLVVLEVRYFDKLLLSDILNIRFSISIVLPYVRVSILPTVLVNDTIMSSMRMCKDMYYL